MPPRLAAFLAIVFWGISFVATKAALAYVSPITLVTTRFAMGLVFLYALLVARRQPLTLPRDTLAGLALLGFIGVFVHQLLQSTALTMTTAVRTGWLIGLTPIWSAVIAATFLGERFGPLRIAGLVLGFLGAVLIVTRGQMGPDVLSLPATRGDFLILASTLNWAIYTALAQRTITRIGGLRSIAGAMLPGWLLLVPLFVAQAGWREYGGVPASTWGAIVFLGFGCSGLAYYFWHGALERIETGQVAAFLYLEPLVTLAAAVLLLGEPVGMATVVGGVLVLAGVFLVQRPTRPKIVVGSAVSLLACSA